MTFLNKSYSEFNKVYHQVIVPTNYEGLDDDDNYASLFINIINNINDYHKVRNDLESKSKEENLLKEKK